jgi:hypothetical protein
VQTLFSGLTALDFARVIGAVLLPLVGVAVVGFALWSFLRPNSANLQGKVQKIKGFGLELEISVLTLFVLIGMTFSLVGTYLVVQDYETKVRETAELKQELARSNEAFDTALRKARQVDVTALIALQDVGDRVPLPEDLVCEVHVFDAKPRRLPVARGVERGQYYVTLDNLSAGQLLQMLECRDSGRRWTIARFNPLEPEYRLRKD